MNEYLFGKGKVSLAERDSNGAISKILYVGNCPELKVSGSADRVDHYESETGTNVRDRSLVKTSAFEMSLTLESLSADNAALLVWGAKNSILAAATQSHVFPEGITNGESHIIPNGFNMSNAVLKDGAGTPIVIPTTKYDLDESFGTINFLDVETYTEPLKLEYDRGAAVAIPFMTQQAPTRFLRFEGLNLGNPGTNAFQKFLVELYIVQFDPVSDLSLIGDDFGKFELKGALQRDETRVANSALGGFGRIVQL